jgi:hypothetical protein
MLLHYFHSTAASRTPLLATVTTVCGWPALGSAIVVTLLHFQSHKALLKLSKHISVWMMFPWITCSIFLCSSTTSICHVCILRRFHHNWAPLCTMCTQYTNNALYHHEKFVTIIDNDVLPQNLNISKHILHNIYDSYFNKESHYGQLLCNTLHSV